MNKFFNRLMYFLIVVLIIVLMGLLLTSDASAADCGKCISVRIAQVEKALNVRPPGYVPYCFGPDLDGDGVGDYCSKGAR